MVPKFISEAALIDRFASSWLELQSELHYCGESYAFRGQSQADWNVRCHLDRKRGTTDPVPAELSVISDFQRKAHLFLPSAREPETRLEWLSLLQHHGGPTRLIDFTRSPLIAVFFALEDHRETDAGSAAVWAINVPDARRLAAKRLRVLEPEKYSWLREHHELEGAVEERLRSLNASPFVAPVESSRPNVRMLLQQGVSMCLGDPGADLLANFKGDNPEAEPTLEIVKITFPRTLRSEALWSLRRLGISREALFPGLDGLAQSEADLLIPRALNQQALLHQLERPNGWPHRFPKPDTRV